MTSRVHLATIQPAGVKYHCGVGYADDIRGGDRFELSWEPDNEYDSQALRIMHVPGAERHGGRHGMVSVGHIPRPLNQALLALLRAGFELHIFAPRNSELLVHIEMDKYPHAESR
jgi:hypothetical protein